jgi:hypothetical protein
MPGRETGQLCHSSPGVRMNIEHGVDQIGALFANTLCRDYWMCGIQTLSCRRSAGCLIAAVYVMTANHSAGSGLSNLGARKK